MGASIRRLAAVVLAASLLAACGEGAAPRSEDTTPTPTTTAPSPSPSESLSPTASPSPTTDLEDGRHPVFIERIRLTGRTITVDVVQWFVGEAAASAAAEDGSEEVPPPNDYWIRNENPRLRTLDVAGDAAIITNTLTSEETGDSTRDVHVTLAKLASLDYRQYALFWITVEEGVVVRIRQQYLP